MKTEKIQRAYKTKYYIFVSLCIIAGSIVILELLLGLLAIFGISSKVDNILMTIVAIIASIMMLWFSIIFLIKKPINNKKGKEIWYWKLKLILDLDSRSYEFLKFKTENKKWSWSNFNYENIKALKINPFDGDKDEEGRIILTDKKVNDLRELIINICDKKPNKTEEKNIEADLKEFYLLFRSNETPAVNYYIEYLKNKYVSNNIIKYLEYYT